MKVDGACHCGEITYQAELNFEKVVICHCTDCQTLAASAFRTVAVASSESFKLLSGEPKIYVKIGGSGARRAQAFCGTCGTAIYASAADEAMPETVNIRAGTMRQRDLIKPSRQIWHRSALSWMKDMNDISTFENGGN